MDQTQSVRMHRLRLSLLKLVLVVTVLGAWSRSYATVELNVTRVGFPTLGSADVVRAGQWVPVIVDLSLVNQPDFDGTLRVGQLDVDGDESFDSVQVHFRAESGGTQRYFLYTLANPAVNDCRFVVELFDVAGQVVEVLSQGELTDQAQPSQRPIVITDDDVLILSLSPGTVGRVRDLVGAGSTSQYINPVRVAHMHPMDLPEHWIGLETVDFVVWDDAQPEELSERQVRALIAWVRQGGTLLLAVSRSVGALRMSDPIYDVLPVDLGDVRSVENLPDLRHALLGDPQTEFSRAQRVEDEWWNEPLPRPVPVVDCTLRPEAVSLSDDADDGTVARARVGRGHLIFSGVLLKDLFGGLGEADEFFENVFHLVPLGDQDARPDARSLFGQVVSAVGFTTRGVTYLLIAGVMSLAYVLVATVGSWQLLGQRGWRRHSWTAFGLVSVVASLLSIFSVGAIRGLGGETLHQISIVDADADSTEGYATTFFGLKSGVDKTLDLWLPVDSIGATEPYATDCFLRPLPVSSNRMDTTGGFADPGSYRLEPASALMHDVRLRATLKRLEGRWKGMLSGSVTGQVSIRTSTILDGSYLINNLGVDLNGCYLLQAVLDLDRSSGPRSLSIFAYPLGDVPSDGKRIDLGLICNPPDEPDGTPADRNQFRLVEAQRDWGSKLEGIFSDFGYGGSADAGLSVGQEKNALRLISTIGDYDPPEHSRVSAMVIGEKTYSRDRLRHLDLRDQLSRDCVILIGFAEDPGPVRLFRRTGDRPFQMLTPDARNSWTMYRIRIPVTLVGRSSSAN